MKSILIGLVALASLAPVATVAHAQTTPQLQLLSRFCSSPAP